jgi:hypothetical protein
MPVKTGNPKPTKTRTTVSLAACDDAPMQLTTKSDEASERSFGSAALARAVVLLDVFRLQSEPRSNRDDEPAQIDDANGLPADDPSNAKSELKSSENKTSNRLVQAVLDVVTTSDSSTHVLIPSKQDSQFVKHNRGIT